MDRAFTDELDVAVDVLSSVGSVLYCLERCRDSLSSCRRFNSSLYASKFDFFFSCATLFLFVSANEAAAAVVAIDGDLVDAGSSFFSCFYGC